MCFEKSRQYSSVHCTSHKKYDCCFSFILISFWSPLTTRSLEDEKLKTCIWICFNKRKREYLHCKNAFFLFFSNNFLRCSAQMQFSLNKRFMSLLKEAAAILLLLYFYVNSSSKQLVAQSQVFKSTKFLQIKLNDISILI